MHQFGYFELSIDQTAAKISHSALIFSYCAEYSTNENGLHIAWRFLFMCEPKLDAA
jgi:hypothetical protein